MKAFCVLMPMNKVPRIVAISTKVIEAFFEAGSLNAPVLFATASIPVNAVHPAANDFMKSQMSAKPVMGAAESRACCTIAGIGAAGVARPLTINTSNNTINV